MIAATVYPALKNHVPLANLIGARIYRDWAGNSPVAPYVVWRVIAVVPDNHLSGRPPSDRYSIGVDVYGINAAQSDALILAARDAMEGIGVMSSGPQSLGYDTETQLWGYTFTTDVHRQR